MSDTTPSAARSSAPQGPILVVEDEADLQDLLVYNLEKEGHHVICATTGEQAVDLARKHKPKLVLLDLMLPSIDGFEVCRLLREQEATVNTPIVMVTARGEETDVVKGLELGADDYIVKPFSPRILMARVTAVLRRHDPTVSDEEAPLQIDDLSIDRARHEVKIADQKVDLTATEFRLLELLASKRGRVFTRQQIIDHIHGQVVAVTDRSVDVQVVGLRRKLGDRGTDIETVRGVGYRFRDSD